jgi:serine/threonine protein kinase
MQFGRYQLAHRLGAGGMAEVFFAHELGPRGFRRDVALKRILPEFAHDQEFIGMLVAEARVSAALQHPVIVQVLDFGEIDGACYLALELVEGWNLRQLQLAYRDQDQVMAPAVACYIVSQIASALAYAHARTDSEGRFLRIVHRDVSPSNIMVSPAGGVKLLDFGIAKAASFLRDEQTRTGILKGKLSYMSPEQAGQRAIDLRSDIFSLGIVFHELLVSTRLFKGSTDAETLGLVSRAVVPAASSLVPGLDPALDDIIAKMLAQAPADRYCDCNELLAALAPFTQGLGHGPSELQSFIGSLGPPPCELTVTEQMGDTEIEILTDDVETIMQAPHARAHPSGAAEPAVRVRPPAQTQRPQRLGWWAAGVATLSVAGLLLTRAAGSVSSDLPHEPNPETAPASSDPAPATRTSNAADPSSDKVSLTISGTQDAEVSLDGKLVGNIPLELLLPRASGTRLLTVERNGFRSYSHQIAAGFDVTFRIDLSPSHRVARASSSLP